METGTSCFTKFDVQRNTLAEYLVSLCTVRSVDTTLAQQVINALDRLDPLIFDKIQVATLERFPEANRNNSYLDFCKHISKAMRLYLAFMEKNKKNRKYVETTRKHRKILDIGSGSGTFSFLCNSLGHHSTGMDKPRHQEKNQSIRLNYLLTQWFNVDVIEHEISPMVTFPIDNGRFDDFALFFPTFHSRWKEQDWDFLFADLIRCATRNDSKIYILINKPKIDNEGDVRFSVDEFSRSIAKLNHSHIRDRSYIVHLT